MRLDEVSEEVAELPQRDHQKEMKVHAHRLLTRRRQLLRRITRRSRKANR